MCLNLDVFLFYVRKFFVLSNLVKLKNKALSLTTKPGVYLMKNYKNKVIYIGKAKNLKNRVCSYFRNLNCHSERILKLVDNVYDFDFIVTDSEFEALILECSLIKQNKPKYNVLLKDSKGFCFVKITTNLKFPKISVVSLKLDDGATYFGPYMNFSHLFPIKQAVKNVNEIFMLPDCKINLESCSKKRPCLNYYIKKCVGICCRKISEFDYRKIVDEAVIFLKNQSTNSVEQIELMRKEMESYADKLDFENAIKIRDRILTIEKIRKKSNIYLKDVESMDVISFAYLKNFVCFVVLHYLSGHVSEMQHFFYDVGYNENNIELNEKLEEFVASFYYKKDETIYIKPQLILIDSVNFNLSLFEKYLEQQFQSNIKVRLVDEDEKFQNFAELAHSNAIEILNNYLKQNSDQFDITNELKRFLNLKNKPERIESFDISNLGDSSIVGGMVVFENGKSLNSNYRKFKIKSILLQNDYASMEEMITRRIKNFNKQIDVSFSKKPNLILIDGGKNHVNLVKRILDNEKFEVPCFGMVKDLNHRTKFLTDGFENMEISCNQNIFHFITQIQDETHRFTLKYNKTLRVKTNLKLKIMSLKGIGEKKALKLISYFKTYSELKNATVYDIAKILSINLELAKQIKNIII